MALCDMCEKDIKGGKPFNIMSLFCPKKALGKQSLRLCTECNEKHKKCKKKSDKTDLTIKCEAIAGKKEKAKGKRQKQKAAVKAKGRKGFAKKRKPFKVNYKNFKYVDQGQIGYVKRDSKCCIGTHGLATCVGLIVVSKSYVLMAHFDGDCELLLDMILDQIYLIMFSKENPMTEVIIISQIVDESNNNYKIIQAGKKILPGYIADARKAANKRFNLHGWSGVVKFCKTDKDSNLDGAYKWYNEKVSLPKPTSTVLKSSTLRLVTSLLDYWESTNASIKIVSMDDLMYDTTISEYYVFKPNDKPAVKAIELAWQKVPGISKISMYNGKVI